MNAQTLDTLLNRQKKELHRALLTASLFFSGSLVTVLALLVDLQLA